MENNRNGELYTLGIWIAKAGKENDFISKWASFAEWTSENMTGAGKAYLLQDDKNPLRFISFGPWKDEGSVQKWRESKEFREFAISAAELLEDFQPNTLRVVKVAG